MPVSSWQSVAHVLGARMENHDFCGEHNDIAEGLEEGCPFCADRDAMRVYRRKIEQEKRRR